MIRRKFDNSAAKQQEKKQIKHYFLKKKHTDLRGQFHSKKVKYLIILTNLNLCTGDISILRGFNPMTVIWGKKYFDTEIMKIWVTHNNRNYIKSNS